MSSHVRYLLTWMLHFWDFASQHRYAKNTFLLLPFVRNKYTQVHLCNQDYEMRAGSAPAESFSRW